LVIMTSRNERASCPRGEPTRSLASATSSCRSRARIDPASGVVLRDVSAIMSHPRCGASIGAPAGGRPLGWRCNSDWEGVFWSIKVLHFTVFGALFLVGDVAHTLPLNSGTRSKHAASDDIALYLGRTQSSTIVEHDSKVWVNCMLTFDRREKSLTSALWCAREGVGSTRISLPGIGLRRCPRGLHEPPRMAAAALTEDLAVLV